MARFANDDSQADRLFACLAEQVKLPLTQIAHAAELMNEKDLNLQIQSRQTITEVSQAAIRLIDGFLLSVKLHNQEQLDLEPVPISSLLYDTADMLYGYARMHNCDLQLDISGKYGPVMANSAAVRSALVNLVYSFSGSVSDRSSRRVIKLAVRRNANGISAGVFADTPGLSSVLFKNARRLYGSVHQPMMDFSNDNAAGVFVADNLFSSFGSTMRVSRLKNLNGLSATFKPSTQLSFI